MTEPAPRYTIDLNCDLGEGVTDDAALIPLVSSANIACGGHAGDDATMRAAVRLAVAHGVSVGAHPGYEDRTNFGRVEVPMPPADVGELIARQVGRLAQITRDERATLQHVKPHGALYHVANRDPATAGAVVAAVVRTAPGVAVVGPPAGCLRDAVEGAGVGFIAECFVDRTYRRDGTLTPRSAVNAVHHDPAAAIGQAVSIIVHGRVTTADGKVIAMTGQTLCVHGDGPQAVALLRRLRERLSELKCAVRPPRL